MSRLRVIRGGEPTPHKGATALGSIALAIALLGPIACSRDIVLAARVPPAAKCHKLASQHIQTAPTCAEAQARARAEESCQAAYPDGINFDCKNMPIGPEEKK